MTQKISEANYYVLLDMYRPEGTTAYPIPYGESSYLSNRVNFNDASLVEPIRNLMLQVQEFEQYELKLYLSEGWKVRLEPYLLSLFWGQVTEGPPTFALLLLKWWSRLQFVLPKTDSTDGH